MGKGFTNRSDRSPVQIGDDSIHSMVDGHSRLA